MVLLEHYIYDAYNGQKFGFPLYFYLKTNTKRLLGLERLNQFENVFKG